MPTAEKAKQIDAARERYGRAAGVIFTEYRGLKVKELQKLRGALREKGGEVQIVKNTLFRIAAGEDGQKFPQEFSSGPTAVAYLYANEPDCAKALLDFAKENKKFVIKGGFIAGKAYDDKQIEALSKLPPKEVLIAQVIGAIAAPLSNLVGVIEALYADPIRVIGAVADKVAEGSPLPEAKPAEPTPAEETPAEAPAEAPTAEETPAEAPAEPAAEATEESKD